MAWYVGYDIESLTPYEKILAMAEEMPKMICLEAVVPDFGADPVHGVLTGVAGKTPIQFQERRVEVLDLVRKVQAD